jgi:hypothetical protein
MMVVDAPQRRAGEGKRRKKQREVDATDKRVEKIKKQREKRNNKKKQKEGHRQGGKWVPVKLGT